MPRFLIALLIVVPIAAASATTSDKPMKSSCDVVGTWVANAHRINGGEMGLAGKSLLLFNETHWARIQAIQDDVDGSAGTYTVRGDSLYWKWELGGSDQEFVEACRVDAEGLHTASLAVSEKGGFETLFETDYRHVE